MNNITDTAEGKYSWDLKVMYSDTAEWEKDFDRIDSLLELFCTFKGKLNEGADILLNAFKASDELFALLEKVYTYSHLLSDLDIGNSANLALYNRACAKYAEISGATAWFEPEILDLPEDIIDSYINNPVLDFYRRSLLEILRDKPYTLSASEEKILGLASDALATPSKVFSALNNVDIVFPEVPDGKGGKVRLTHSLFTKLLENNDRTVRKSAFDAMYDTFSMYKNTLASTLEGCVKTHVLNAGIRKFPSALQASLHNDNVSQDVYDNLIASVRKNLPEFEKYIHLRSEMLNIEDLNMYDLHCPIVPEKEVDIPWDEACSMVADAVGILGDEYLEITHKAFSSGWIDVFERPGKRSGAYSSGCYDSPPYILMNYNGTLNDVFTLAHELGHSMHSFYSNKHQEYHYASYRIFVAEVASITNELILHD